MLRYRTLASLGVALLGSGVCGAQSYESYYLYLGGYPIAETNWSDDVQGVAHDDNSWFITQTEVLWRIPVERDLRTVSSSDPNVIRRPLSAYPALAGYHHTGDPVVYKYDGVNYLLVPLEGPGFLGTVAVFYCEGLIYIDHVQFTNQSGDAGWCAVDQAGRIYSSAQHAFNLKVYDFDWPLLQSANQAALTLHGVQPMTDEQGAPLELVTMQGGEFAPGDELLYVISGFYDDDDGLEEREGIHALRRMTDPNGQISWQRVAHSTRGYGHFDFYYDPGFPTYEEPEGLTVWDLEDGQAPGIRGQLHALVSDNDADAGDVDFKHYTHIIRVNKTSSCESGTPTCPFKTVGAALNLAWHGAEIRIRANTYAEPLMISKRVRLSAENGAVRIGG